MTSAVPLRGDTVPVGFTFPGCGRHSAQARSIRPGGVPGQSR